MSMIKVTNLSFGYEDSFENVFSNINLVIDTNWRLGFTGRNGRGKTTFLHLLMGKYPYQGSITTNEHFVYFPFSIEDPNDFTIDVLRNLVPNRQDWEIICELSLLDMNEETLYQPFDLLSQGQQTKALIAAMFLMEHTFLLIDEPTNHLDMEGRKLLSEYLKKKHGFILVSHDRAFLDGCIDHILAINKQNIEIQQGNFSSWWQNKQQQDALEIAHNTKLKKEIGRLNQSARKKADWSNKVEKSKNGTRNSGSKLDKGYVGHKSAKMMKRAHTIQIRSQKAIKERAALMKNIDVSEDLQIHPLPYHSNILCSGHNLTIQYGNHVVIQSLNFSIQKGHILALKGKNGIGKSSLLKLIGGQDIPHTGQFDVGHGLIVSYVPQTIDHLSGSLSNYADQKGIDYTQFLTLLRKFGFAREQFDIPLESYSAGQKKKILLARSLCERAHLYIWDEPLNYIDVISRMQIEQLIKNTDITMIFVEHDQAFSNAIANEEINI